LSRLLDARIWGGDVPHDLGALGRQAEAAEPSERFLNLLGFKTDGVQLAFEVLPLRACITSPVVFVNEDENFKHATNIAQKTIPGFSPLDFGFISGLCCVSDHGQALKQPAWQTRYQTFQFERHQIRLELRSGYAGSGLQRVQPHRVKPKGGQQAIFCV